MCGVYRSATFQGIFTQRSYVIHETLAASIVANTIGERIQKLRYSLNLTQLEFAKSIHRGFGTVTKWEQGITVPSDEAIEEIIRVYELNEDYFNF